MVGGERGGAVPPGGDPPGSPRSWGETFPPRPPRPPGLALRAFQCWLTVYRRIWRSSIWSSVLGPVCYLAALGAAGLHASGRRIGKLLLV